MNKGSNKMKKAKLQEAKKHLESQIKVLIAREEKVRLLKTSFAIKNEIYRYRNMLKKVNNALMSA